MKTVTLLLIASLCLGCSWREEVPKVDKNTVQSKDGITITETNLSRTSIFYWILTDTTGERCLVVSREHRTISVCRMGE